MFASHPTKKQEWKEALDEGETRVLLFGVLLIENSMTSMFHEMLLMIS